MTSGNGPDDAADFYVGQGAGAEYLGTVEQLGDVCELLAGGRFEPAEGGRWSEDRYREQVAEQLAEVGGVTSWPWGHESSAGTGWAYTLQGGHTLNVWRRGYLFGVLYPGHASGPARPRRSSPFPRMVTQGEESAAPARG